jgi:hypothetical protein
MREPLWPLHDHPETTQNRRHGKFGRHPEQSPLAVGLAKEHALRLTLQSAELDQILKQKAAGSPAHSVKGYAALIEPSELNWGEAKLSC